MNAILLKPFLALCHLPEQAKEYFKEGRAFLLRYVPATAAARDNGLKAVRIRTWEHFGFIV
jgi:hypothetical protein